jgi:rhamnogalacturonan acetylesterase
MALNGGGSGTQGWGPYLPYSTKNIEVVNRAIGGRSARSYTNEGRFTAIVDLVVPGDYVIIEFGHNDGGSLSPTNDNLRSACLGSGSETCVGANGAIVQTYVTYLTNAAKALVAKGAKVIISSPTPNNSCEGTTCVYTPPRFTEYCRKVVSNVGSSASFVDHGQYVGNRFITLGKATVDSFFPVDHTHPSPKGSDVVQAAFVKGVLCSGNAFGSYIKNTTAGVLGYCI